MKQAVQTEEILHALQKARAAAPEMSARRDELLPEIGRLLREQDAVIYDRSKLRQGDVIPGPAIITEMDSTTLVESGCTATIDKVGNILINPNREG